MNKNFELLQNKKTVILWDKKIDLKKGKLVVQ